jgi:hypothetical protein
MHPPWRALDSRHSPAAEEIVEFAREIVRYAQSAPPKPEAQRARAESAAPSWAAHATAAPPPTAQHGVPGRRT